MNSIKIVLFAICAVVLAIGVLLRNPTWILGGLGGALATWLMPLEMPGRV